MTANSHKVIHNLLERVENLADNQKYVFKGLKMGNPDNEDTFYDGNLIKTDKNEKHYIDGLKDNKILLYAGTKYHISSWNYRSKIDYLFIDEASQFSLADLIALGGVAKNIILVGPLPGDQNREIVFPVLSPDPRKDKNYNFGKYSIHVGGNRGRGQVYPTGDKSNNNLFTATNSGTITSIETNEDGTQIINLNNDEGESFAENIPAGTSLLVKEGDTIEKGANLTEDPNVGGFGQLDKEIVLQSKARVIGMIIFFIGVGLSQIMLVLKKKQVEKVQAAEGI